MQTVEFVRIGNALYRPSDIAQATPILRIAPARSEAASRVAASSENADPSTQTLDGSQSRSRSQEDRMEVEYNQRQDSRAIPSSNTHPVHDISRTQPFIAHHLVLIDV
ncbi:hypothetical protein FRC02_001691 [Tulasnella sp. 418]|nr:hypothetical protein FRC02_001691 [Tulasnella sp. 418]